MIPASRRNKTRVHKILIDSFQKDPHANWFTSPNDQGRDKRMRSLMNFAVEEGLAQQGVYLSDDQNAVAIWKSPTEKKMGVPLMRAYLDFGMKMGWSKMRKILQMEERLKENYPNHPDYLYLWFLGVMPEHQGKGLSSELLRPMLAMADQMEQDVYLETTNPQNVSIYGKKGFVVYDQWTLDTLEPIKIYCMRRGVTKDEDEKNPQVRADN